MENDADNIKKFLWNQIVCKYDIPMKVVIDRESENRKQLKQYCEEIRIKWIVINVYNPATNDVIEIKHILIANILSKLTDNIGTNWLKHLPIVIFADQISIYSFYKRIPFELIYSHETLLPIETEILIWHILEWDEIETKEDLVLF